MQIKNGGRNLVQPIIEIIAKFYIKINPNIITLLGLLFAIVSFVFLYYKLLLLASLFIFLSQVHDAIDGTTARNTNKTSVWGEFMDATFDRISDSLYIFGIALTQLVNWQLCFVALISSFLVSYVSARCAQATAGKESLKIGIGQRGHRSLIIIISIALSHFNFHILKFNILEVGIFLLIFFAVITLVLRIKKAFSVLQY